MKKYLRFSGPALIVFAAFLWGLDGILRRDLSAVAPIVIVFFEHLIGLVILAPFFIKTLWKEKMTGKEWVAIILVAIFSGVLATLWFTIALQSVNFISFSVVFLLQKLQPVFTIITAAIVLKEKITRKYIIWAGLAFVAAYFVTFPGGYVNLATGQGTITAALFAVAAAAGWGATTAFSRYTLLKHSETYITGWRFTLSALFAFMLMIPLGHVGTQLASPHVSDFLYLLGIALSSGMVALWIYYRGLKDTEAKISTILELVFPATAVFIDIVLYHTVLAWSQYAAALVLIFAVAQISRLNSAKTKTTLATPSPEPTPAV